MPCVEPAVERHFRHIGSVLAHQLGVAMLSVAVDDPSHVCPKTAIARGVRIPLLVRLLVMNAMRGNPENRATFQSHRTTDAEEVIQPFRHLIGAVGMETVISHPDSASDAEPVQARGNSNRFPIPIEKDRNDGKNMKSGKPGSGQPVDGLSALVSVDFSGQGF